MNELIQTVFLLNWLRCSMETSEDVITNYFQNDKENFVSGCVIGITEIERLLEKYRKHN